MSAQASARTYNQDHIPRKYTPGKRRVSIYWTWSYPWESQRDLAEMDNRFSTMTDVRRVAWPAYETQEWSAAQFLQGIAGTLELFHRSTLSFQKIAGETTGHPVAVFQRIDQAGYKLPIDERILADADTLMVFGLDHIASEQEAAPEEIAAIREWLKRDGSCLLLAPHHDVGFAGDPKQRQMEYLHHGDPLVPRQQRFGQYTRSLMKGLGVPVHNTYGLRPALVKGTNEIAPLTASHDLDSLGLLRNVPTLNFHPHLPHYELTGRRNLRPGAGAAADRPRTSAPFHRGGRQGVQLPPVDAAERAEGRGHRSGRFDQFHHPLWRHEESRDFLEESRGDEVSGASREVSLRLGRALYTRKKKSLRTLARYVSFAGALSVASPVLADSDRPDLVNGTGDDPTQPLGKIELLDRYTEAPGPGVEEGTTKTSRNQHALRPDRGAAQARAAMGTELPCRNSGRVDKRSDTREPHRRDRVRLRQRARSGVDRTRLGSTLGSRARRAADRADLDQRSGVRRLGTGHGFGRPRDAPGD